MPGIGNVQSGRILIPILHEDLRPPAGTIRLVNETICDRSSLRDSYHSNRGPKN